MAIKYGRQFTNYSVRLSAQEPDHPDTREMYNGQTAVPTASVSVEKPHEDYEYPMRTNWEAYGTAWEFRKTEKKGRHRLSDHLGGWGNPKFEEDNGQGELFKVHHTPPIVDTLFSHHDLKGEVPGLLGRAALESKAQFGEYPEASTDLSRHSKGIVDRLVSKGIIKDPFEAKARREQEFLGGDPEDYYQEQWSDNEISARDPYYEHYREPANNASDEVPAWHQALGRQFMRHVLRGDRPQQSLSAPTFSQDPLF